MNLKIILDCLKSKKIYTLVILGILVFLIKISIASDPFYLEKLTYFDFDTDQKVDFIKEEYYYNCAKTQKEQDFYEKILFSNPRYKKFQIGLSIKNPTDEGDFKFSFIFYKVKRKDPRPVVLIFPTIVGITIVEKRLAHYLAKRGINAVIAEFPEDISQLERPISDIDNLIIRMTVAVRSIIDYLETVDNVDIKHIAGFGGSLGGVRLIFAMGIDPRIGSGIAYVTGGDIPHILAYSTVNEVRAYRRRKMRDLGLRTRKEYEERLRDVISLDPLDFAPYIDPSKLMLAISLNDTSIPSRTQIELKWKLHSPYFFTSKYNHACTVFFSIFNHGKIKNFYEYQWGIEIKKD